MLQVQLGYAAGSRGNGVGYMRLTSRSGERLVRVAFHARRRAGLEGRDVSYAALTAAARLLHQRGIEAARFCLPDRQVVEDQRYHREVPAALALPYVHLGCALNRFKRYDLCVAEDADLTQRARAEVALSQSSAA
jgi:hypothetical protein